MRKGEATRQRIIEQAAPIFNRQGFAGSSMQDLVEATGLEKGGLYRHFASKEELAAEAFRYTLAINTKVRTDHLDAIPGAIAKLRHMVHLFIETPSAVAGGCPILNTAIEADDGNPILRDLALDAVRQWRRRLARIVEQGLRAGEIRAGTRPSQIANSIIATLEGALMISRLERNRTALRDAQALLNQAFDKLQTDPGE